MPSKADCANVLRDAAGRDVLTDQQARDIIKEIETLAKNKAQDRSKSRAYRLREAAAERIGEMEFEAQTQKRNEVLQFLKRDENTQLMQRFKSPFGAISAMLIEDVSKLGGEAGVTGSKLSVEHRTRAIHRQAMSEVELGLEKKPGLVKLVESGKIDKEFELELEQLTLKEGMPGISGNAHAKEAAAIFHPVIDRLFHQKNRAGASAKTLPGYTVRQEWNGKKVRDLGGKNHSVKGHKEASFKEFARLMMAWEVDAEATYGFRDAETFLRHVHEEFYSENFGRVELVRDETGAIVSTIDHRPDNGGGSSLANKLSAKRVIHFKNADGRRQAREALGNNPRLLDALIAQIARDSRSIALMDKFGPNVEKGFADMYGIGAKMARQSGDNAMSAPFQGNFENNLLKNYWRIVSGQTEQASHSPVARGVEYLLMIQSTSKLAGSTITSITDIPFVIGAVSRELGVPKMQAAMKVAAAMPSAFNAFGRFSRDGNAKSLYYKLNKVMVDSIGGEAGIRWGADLGQSAGDGGLTRWANTKFFRWNFLSQWTNSMKAVAFRVHAAILGEMSHHKFDALPDEVATGLREAGITHAEWDLLRGAATDEDGVLVLGPDVLDNLSAAPLMTQVKMKDTPRNRQRMMDELRTKVISYFVSFQDRAVPTPGVRERSIATAGGQPKNTLFGAVTPLMMQFKAFPITVVNKVLRQSKRNAEFRENLGSHYLNMAWLVGATMMTGYMSGMFKDLLRGRTPKPLNTKKTWADAALRGGGLGIYGDILFQRYDRSINKASATLLGPTASSVIDPLASLPGKLAEGDFMGAGKTLKDMAAQNVPKAGLAHLLLIKPVFDYFIGFSMNEFFDPDWERKMKARLEKGGQGKFGHGDPENR